MNSSAIDYPDKPNDLEAFWMPFTANRGYKRQPRLLSGAKGMHYTTPDGRWRRRPASRRSTSTARRGCSSAPRNSRPTGRTRSGRCTAATT